MFCPHGCFVPTDVLSPRMFCPPDVLSDGCFVPTDVLSNGRFVATDVLSPRTFCPHECFVPTDVLSTDVLSPDVLSPDVLSGHLLYSLFYPSLPPPSMQLAPDTACFVLHSLNQVCNWPFIQLVLSFSLSPRYVACLKYSLFYPSLPPPSMQLGSDTACFVLHSLNQVCNWPLIQLVLSSNLSQMCSLPPIHLVLSSTLSARQNAGVLYSLFCSPLSQPGSQLASYTACFVLHSLVSYTACFVLHSLSQVCSQPPIRLLSASLEPGLLLPPSSESGEFLAFYRTCFVLHCYMDLSSFYDFSVH